MAINLGKTIAFLAVGGMVAGTAACGGAADAAKAAGDDAAKQATAKACCKGLNECKTHGGCKTDKNDCAGKNACKGQGGPNSGPGCPAK